MSSNKRKRKSSCRPTIHPRNKYSETRPDFALLASLYPTFEPFVLYTEPGRPRIDWTDFNATRELTRILLFHDHNLNWWIPDGQLCPTVPNRSNYIHWIEDLLSSDIIPKINTNNENVRGFDIGTGANCIYPLLGASLLGWSFVGSDVTDVAVEWATKNVEDNPHISELIEIIKANAGGETLCIEDLHSAEVSEERDIELNGTQIKEANKSYQGPPVLLGVVKDGEKFDFCMCNPPFFETMDEAGLNPKTSCGGTPDEMVCNGGEKAFITRIIEDSSVLKQSFRWYTSMIGRKSNLKFLIAKLWDVGVTIVKTTEFVQGQTCRWGLAWSFVPPTKKIISPQIVKQTVFSFTIEGIQRQFSAIIVLQYVESFFSSSGALCKSNTALFSVDITMPNDHLNSILIKKEEDCTKSSCPSSLNLSNSLSFRITIFQQIPGTLLVKGNLQQKDISVSGLFSLIFQNLEEELKTKFCRKRPI